MTNSEALILIDCIVANAIGRIDIDRINEQKTKEGFLEGVVTAIAAIFEVQGRPNNENNA